MSNPERWRKFRRLPSNIQARLAQLAAFFKEENVDLAYLFGSLSQAETGHDVDLAILRYAEPAHHLWGALSNRLDTERLDLVDLSEASPVLRFDIISTGKLLYAKNDDVCNNFEMATLREYKDTAWLRRRQGQILRERVKTWSSNQNPSSKD